MKRNKFSLSNYKLFSCDMGELIPCGLFEVLPGDTVQHNTSVLLRCSPLLSPVMHPVHVRVHHWFVPYRLIWNDFENFITGGPDGLNASVYPTKTFVTGPAVGTLSDYLGVPTGVNNINVSALPYRAYAMIWNENYRDPDLETALTVDLASGADTTTAFALQRCAWEKDYFTTSRPWEQKGPSITLPLGSTAPVNRVSNAPGWTAKIPGTNTNMGNQSPLSIGGSGAITGPLDLASLDPGAGALAADLSSASAITVNALREALALQRFAEARARYGSRYVEYLRYRGVRSSDARLQRPEYLGGGRQTVQFSEVLQTAPVTSNGVVGELKGHGIAGMRSNRYRRFFEEHGIVVSLLSVKPKTMYAQGLPRFWNRRVREDFHQIELEHIGQQEVLNKEVYAAHASPNAVFGYQDRYDEYRHVESTIAGEFRNTTLDFWHFARIFASSPALNASFVSCVPTERTFAVPAADNLYIMANHSIQARRPLSKEGSSFIF